MNDSAVSTGAQITAAGLQGLTLAIVGLPYFAVFWGLMGALCGLAISPQESRKAALVTVLLSWAAGSAGGFAVAAYLGGANPALIISSFVIGTAAKRLLVLAIEAASAQITKLGQK